jgi:hypothetical protein
VQQHPALRQADDGEAVQRGGHAPVIGTERCTL